MYILLICLLVSTSYQQSIPSEHRRRQCDALQTSEVMGQALPEIRRYLQADSKSSKEQHEETKASLKNLQIQLETTIQQVQELNISAEGERFQTELETNRRHQKEVNASLEEIQIEFETSRRHQKEVNASLEEIQIELETSRRHQKEVNASLEEIQIELERSRRKNEETNASLRRELETTREHLRHLNASLEELLMSRCENGWRYRDGYCYKFILTLSNYEEAKSICQNLNASVTDITSERENEFIKTESEKLEKENTGFGYYLLGGYFNLTEGEWIWERTREKFVYTRWAPGEHGDRNNPEGCVLLQRNVDYQWKDVPCSIQENVICKRSVYTP